MALHLPILDKCNIQCVFCSATGRGGGYAVEDLKRAISEDKTGHIQISGGDPLLRAPLEVLAIVAHAKKLGKVVEFQTNAVLATRYDQKRLKQIIGLSDYFNINFSAHTPELDVAVTKTPGAFAQREEGVEHLLDLGARVRLTYIVNKVNYRYCADFLGYLRARLPRVAWVQFSYVKGMGLAKHNRDVIPRFRVAAPYLNEAMRVATTLGPKAVIDHIPACFVRDWLDHHVDYQKMREETPGIHLEEKRKTGDCEGCALAPSCPGPRRDYVELFGAL